MILSDGLVMTFTYAVGITVESCHRVTYLEQESWPHISQVGLRGQCAGWRFVDSGKRSGICDAKVNVRPKCQVRNPRNCRANRYPILD